MQCFGTTSNPGGTLWANKALAGGALPRVPHMDGEVRQGKAVQVADLLKAPGTRAKRLKPKHDRLLLSFAFNLNLRRYNKARKYCPTAPPPCPESTLRETVFLDNVAKIETHNAGTSGMKMGITRFAVGTDG